MGKLFYLNIFILEFYPGSLLTFRGSRKSADVAVWRSYFKPIKSNVNFGPLFFFFFFNI